MSAIRKFLEGEGKGKIEMVVVVTFERKDVGAYGEMIPLFFPPVPEGEEIDEPKDAEAKEEVIEEESKNEEELEAEAQAIANELPDPPKRDPGDDAGTEHVEKKQKQRAD